MLKRTALIALAAAASLGLAISASTSTMAKPIFKPIPVKPIKPFKPIKVVKIHWHPTYRVVRPVVAATAIYPVVKATKACLTKEYLPTGQVLFKDVCTNEWAMNPPPVEQTQLPAAQAQVQAPAPQAQ